MTNTSLLPCDGCGQLASPEHIAKRLQRLEWTTRYRPVHIGALLLGAVAPEKDSEFLYAEGAEFAGEAGIILEATGLSTTGKPAEATLAEFQRGGFLLTYVLDCPLERGANDAASVQKLLEKRFPAVLTRIRRSLKPKRLVPVSRLLESLLSQPEKIDAGCPIVLDGSKPFSLDGDTSAEAIAVLRQALRP
jgi:hypothetical protein